MLPMLVALVIKTLLLFSLFEWCGNNGCRPYFLGSHFLMIVLMMLMTVFDMDLWQDILLGVWISESQNRKSIGEVK